SSALRGCVCFVEPSLLGYRCHGIPATSITTNAARVWAASGASSALRGGMCFVEPSLLGYRCHGIPVTTIAAEAARARGTSGASSALRGCVCFVEPSLLGYRRHGIPATSIAATPLVHEEQAEQAPLYEGVCVSWNRGCMSYCAPFPFTCGGNSARKIPGEDFT